MFWQRSALPDGRLQQHVQRSKQHHRQQHALLSGLGSKEGRGVAARASASDSTASRTAGPAVISSRHDDMVWASCVSSKSTVRSAVEDTVSSIMQQQPDLQPDLALVFASCNYGSQLQDVVRAIRREVPSVRHVFGCSVSRLVWLNCRQQQHRSHHQAMHALNEPTPCMQLSSAGAVGFRMHVVH
jgi:hypothetical protein